MGSCGRGRLRAVSLRAVSTVVLSCALVAGLPLSRVQAAPVGEGDAGEDTVAVPAPMAPGMSTYDVMSPPEYVMHEVSTPQVVSADLAAPASVDAIVAGLPVSIRVVPSAGDNPEDTRPVVLGVDSLDAAATDELGAEVLAFGVQPSNANIETTLLVTVDYSEFRYALGADWADRLELSLWPCSAAFADVSPDACGKPVSIGTLRNDLQAGTLSALVHVGGTSTSGGFGAAAMLTVGNGSTLGLTTKSGSFAATSLSNTGKWSVPGNTGSFTYSYPMAAPPAFNGLGPSLSLGYNSGVVDGVTTDSNPQASEVGQGWSLSAGQGFIERSYVPCKTIDTTYTLPDSCWWAQGGTISLNGRSSTLVPINGTPDVEDSFTQFRLADDADWLVQRFNSPSGNWWTSEYWTVTTPEGYTYTFGLNDQGQNSRMTRLLIGWKAGEPCHTNANWFCTDMPYRWMLDKVTDPFGNTMVYKYELQKNWGRSWGNLALAAQYDAESLLTEVDYGKSPNAGITGFRDRVLFSYARRCVQALSTGNDADCPTVSNANGPSYPDVPTDLYCTAACNKDVAFFHTKRLTAVTTQTSADGSAWSSVAKWKLSTAFPTPQDNTNEKLQLSSIVRVDPSTGAALMPGTYFGQADFRGREDANPAAGVPYLFQFRLSVIIDDLGKRTDVTYATVACPTPWDWSVNQTDCHPAPDGASFGIFRRYHVDKVVETDLVTGAAGQTGTAVTPTVTYQYLWGAAAWHFSRGSWTDFRGYSFKWVITGTGTTKTSNAEFFYQGMNGDLNSSFAPKTVSMSRGWTTTPEGYSGTILDDDWLAGQVFESRQGVQLFVGQVSANRDYYRYTSTVTGTVTRTGQPALVARKYRVTLQHGLVRDGTSASPVLRHTRTDYSYDVLGRQTSKHSSGFMDITGDEACEQTWYLSGSTLPTTTSPGWMNLVAQTAGYALVGALPNQTTYAQGGCGTATSAPVSVSKQFFNSNPNATGSVANSAVAQPIAAGFKPYVTAAMTRIKNNTPGTDELDRWLATRSTYDAAGRVTSTIDANGVTSATFGFDATYGYPNSATYPTVNGITMSTSTVLRPGDGQPSSTTDQNGRVTTYCYDRLSRAVAQFLPRLDGAARTGDLCGPLALPVASRPATTDAPNVEYTYDIGAFGGFLVSKLPSIVTTSVLQTGTTYADAVRVQSAAYIDGMGHTRETQAYSPTTGKIIVAASLFDERGNQYISIDPFVVTDSAPGDRTSATGGSNGFASWPNLPSGVTLRTSTTTYDDVNRPLSTVRKWGTTTLNSTSTDYQGSVTYVKPSIGSWVATTADGLGRTTKVAVYNGTTAPAAQGTLTDGGSITTYAYNYDQNPNVSGGYDRTGWLTTVVTDDALKQTSVLTDLAGRTVTSTDPNAGVSNFVYDASGQVTKTTDAAGNVVNTAYDVLGRPTGRWSGSAASFAAATGTDRLASWAYDTVAGGQGLAAVETSWQAGLQYTSTVLSYNPRYQVTSSQVSVPGTFGTDVLAGDWKFQSSFNEAGQQVSVSTPTAPVDPATPAVSPTFDVATTGFNGLGVPYLLWQGPTTTPVDGSVYVKNTVFDDLGRVQFRTLAQSTLDGTPALRRTYGYDAATGMLSTVKAGWTTIPNAPSANFQNDAYTRDAIGNVTQVVDNGADPDVANPAAGVASAVKECFLYDQWNRLVRATSAATAATCPTSTGAATIATGTRDAYDMTWSFNDVNRMVSRTDKMTSTATTYTYGDTAHPSALTATSGGVTGTYSYNPVGAMTSRNGTTLSYDALQRLTGYGSVESYRYSVSNQRLVRTAGTTRTLYLPGMEVTDAAGSVTVTRFLTIGGANVATKTTSGAGTSVAWNCGSLQNSTVCQADAATPNVVPARKRYAPYGGDRNAVTFTTTDHGFLGQPEDGTGLTYLNNRYYDPALGNFTSVDPLVGRTGTPYLYAAGNPSTLSDPSGLCAHNNGRQGYDDGKGDCARKGYPGATTSACWGAPETPQYCVTTTGTKADFADGLMRRWDGNWNKTEAERAEYFLTLMGGDPGNLDFAFEMARDRKLAEYWIHHPDEALSMGTWRPAMDAMWAAGAIWIAEGAGSLGGVATPSAADDLQSAAARAEESVGPGRGPVYGTRVHTAFAEEVAALGRADVFTEVSYLNGQVVPYGTPGSVRLDAVVGSPSAPTAIYDLKTGSATLTTARIAQIQSQLPAGFQNVPVVELRP